MGGSVGTSYGYRENANDMSTQEQIDELKAQVEKNHLSRDQQMTLKMTRNIVLGILGFTALTGGMAFGCNHQDNQTKLEVSKQCPAVSPILAVGLTTPNK